jgi:hypothetical protein
MGNDERAAPSDESILLESPEPTESYLQRVDAEIKRRKARTADVVAIVLLVALAASLPLSLFAIWLIPDHADQAATAFDRWYNVVGPLAGAAIGAYFVTSTSDRRRTTN